MKWENIQNIAYKRFLTLRFSDVLRGQRKGALGINELKKFIDEFNFMATLTTFYNECLIEMDVTVKTKTLNNPWMTKKLLK